LEYIARKIISYKIINYRGGFVTIIKKKTLTFFQLAILGILFVTNISLHAESNINKINDNLYTISGFGGNVAFFIDEEGVLVVDGGYTPSHGEQILRLIRTISDKSIKYFVLTHYHPDHIRGAQSIIDNSTVVVQENLHKNIQRFGVESLNNDIQNRYPEYINNLKDQINNYSSDNETPLNDLRKDLKETELLLGYLKTIRLVSPNITFQDKVTINMANETIELNYLGPGHTSGNTIVYFKNSNTVHLGDLFFHDAYPYIDFEAGSNTENWIKILETVYDWDIDHVIPGHGAITNKEGIKKQINYLIDLRSAVKEGINEGKSLEELKNEITLQSYNDYVWPVYLKIGIEAIFNEMMQ
jgi:glyoxylase-like metal-dependent hydrolase (beta-lactamase superfamily II)